MRYISDSVISFSITLNGKDKRVRFSPLMGGGSMYIAENADEIKLLESLGSYKRNVFRRAPECKDLVIEDSSDTEKKVQGTSKKGQKNVVEKTTEGNNAKVEKVDSVTTIQEAAEYLAEKFELEMDDLADPDAILAKAAENKIEFPNLK